MMKERKHRELFWPLMLIVIGVILLLRQLGIWEFSWARLWRLWPLLLILIGLDIILSRSRLGSVIFLILATALIVLAILFLPASSEERVAPDHQTFDHPARGVDTANIYLDMGVGELDVYPLEDSGNLFEADASYNRTRTRATSDVDMVDGEATVHLEARSTASGWMPFGDQNDNAWNVGLNTSVPMALHVAGGVNRTSLDLEGLTLKEIRLEIGVGQAELVLSEKIPYKVVVEGGVGQLKLRVPPQVEARIRVEGGLGSVNLNQRFQRRGDYYVTEEYQEGQGVEIEVKGGIGSIDIR
ncbi:MAG: LiaF transmembrane domain-containing protein [Anaerolineales bacterium]